MAHSGVTVKGSHKRAPMLGTGGGGGGGECVCGGRGGGPGRGDAKGIQGGGKELRFTWTWWVKTAGEMTSKGREK